MVVTKRTICARYIYEREERERELLLLLLQRVRNFFFFCLFLCARARVLSEKGAFYQKRVLFFVSFDFGEEKARGERFTRPREKGGSVCSMNRDDDDDDDAMKKQRE